jgi:N utilization substance protein A
LSLAIGKKGQNVRLAAKLLGWKIDIKSEEEKRQEVEEQMSAVMNQTVTPLESIPDLEPGIIEKLVAAGITTVEAVADMTPEQLEEVPGIGPKTVEKISIAVNNYFSSLEAEEAPAAEAVAEEGVAAEEAAATEELTEYEAASEETATEEATVKEDNTFEGLPGSEENPLPDDAELEGGGDYSATGPDSAGQSGDVEGLSEGAEDSSDSVEDLVESGQYYEAEVVDGIENAPDADVAEVTTHERPVTDDENIPEEELPGEKR